MEKWRRYRFIRVIVFFIGGLVFISAVSAVLMLLWNHLIPQLFNGPVIHFKQALGLLILSHILFRGFGSGWRGGGCGYGGWKGHSYWRSKMQSKLASMSPEEREKFKNSWRNRCGYWDDQEKESNTGSENM